MRFFVCLMAAALLLGGRAAAEATFQPEVLLTKTAKNGTQKWFEYAKLKPATTTLMYRAAGNTVKCDITATPPRNGTVHVTLLIQRTTTLPDGHEDVTTKTEELDFRPGQSLIVDTQPHPVPNSNDGSVETLQLTLLK